MFTKEYIEELFALLEPLKGIEQDKKWHPEKDVHNHSFQALMHALRETRDTDLILAALMHDVGKSVNKLGHDKEGSELIRDVVSVKTDWLVKNHMRINHYLDGTMVRGWKAMELQTHPWFKDLVALNRWDKIGRRANFEFNITAEKLAEELNFRANDHFKEKPSEPRGEISRPSEIGVRPSNVVPIRKPLVRDGDSGE